MKLLLSMLLSGVVAFSATITINSGNPITYQDVGALTLQISSSCGSANGSTINVGSGSIPGTSWVACGTSDASNSTMRFWIELPFGYNESLASGTGVLVLDTTADSGWMYAGTPSSFAGRYGSALYYSSLHSSLIYPFNADGWNPGAGVPVFIEVWLQQANGPVKIDYQVTYDTQWTENPEPGTLVLIGTGVGLLLLGRKKHNA